MNFDPKIGVGDLIRYYSGCEVQLLDKKIGPRWVTVVRFDDTSKGLMVTVCDSQDKQTVYPIKTTEFDVSWPACKFYFYRGQALYLTKIPVREGHKSLSGSNGFFVNPLTDYVPSNFATAIISVTRYHDRQNILNLGNTQFPIPQAQDMLRRDHAISVPIADEWAISLSPFQEKLDILWKQGTPVGKLDERGRIHTIEPLYEQEIKDTFHREIV